MEEMSCVMNNDEIMNLVESAITLFYRKIANVDHHRFKSWEYCYQNFIEARSRTLNSLDYVDSNLILVCTTRKFDIFFKRG